MTNKTRFLSILVTSGVLWFAALPAAFAQCELRTSIGPNDSASGSLSVNDCTIAELELDPDDMTFVDLYEIVLPARGTLTVDMQSSSIDTFIGLFDSEIVTVVGSDDDGGTGSNSRLIVDIAAGTYTILANSFFVETGQYTLQTTFSPAAGSCNVRTPISSGTVGGALGPGDCTVAELDVSDDDFSYIDQYEVTLPSGGSLTVQLNSSVVDSFVWLVDSSTSNIIATDDDSGGGLDSQLDLDLAPGSYVILANSTQSPGTGDYTLTTTCTGCAEPSGPLAAAVLPTSRAPEVGTPAPAFATIINAANNTAIGCSIAPLTMVPATFSYQTTDPATNALTGSINTPADIAPGQAQSFVFQFTPNQAIPTTEVEFLFDCPNTNAAGTTPGVNTFILTATDIAGPDVIAIGLTATGDGIVHIPGTTGAVAASLATFNVGAPGTVTVSTDTGGADLGLAIFICQSDASTGACLADPSTNVTLSINSNDTPTFSVFVNGTVDVPANAATNRINIKFSVGDTVVGSTSFAVQTDP